MSVRPLFMFTDGTVVLQDVQFSADEVLEVALAYQQAVAERDDDFDNGRTDHHARWTEPAAQTAADLLHTAASPRMTFPEARALAHKLLEVLGADPQAVPHGG